MFGGMEMMLKSLGIDPEGITKTAQEMATTISNIEQGQARIEGKLDLIIAALTKTGALVAIEESKPE